MITLSISGMTCASCTHHVQEALLAVAGVSSAMVSYDEANAVIETDTDIHEKTLLDAVATLGYKAKVVALGNNSRLTKDEDTEELHVAIIGSGSAAFACAIKAADDAHRRGGCHWRLLCQRWLCAVKDPDPGCATGRAAAS